MASALVRLYCHCSVTYPGLGRGKVKLSEHYHMISRPASQHSQLETFYLGFTRVSRVTDSYGRNPEDVMWWCRDDATRHLIIIIQSSVMTSLLKHSVELMILYAKKRGAFMPLLEWMNEWILHWWLTICVLLFCLIHFRCKIYIIL